MTYVDGSRARGALARGVRALAARQADDGSFEGEVVWCPMLAAQHVIAWHLAGIPIPEARRARLLLHFEETRLSDGTWGLHELSRPYLFVTTLVYVAARLLGLAPTDALLERGLAFIRREGGATAIPSWGKLWLALAGLYDYRGVAPVFPETWLLPKQLPLHPSRWYCHTRSIYLGMALLYGQRWQGEMDPALRAALRDELYPAGWERVDWAAARSELRAAELHVPWSLPLRAGYAILHAVEPLLPKAPRAKLLVELREHLRYEFRATDHTAISPVSGLLGILALLAADPGDPDGLRAVERFEGWVWDDAEHGARVTGARSASWDTAFAAQTLAAAAPHVDVRAPLGRADGFLETQQIKRGTGREADVFRIDPTGGYCFAGVWHGWPVSDCTAEALLGRLDAARRLGGGVSPDAAEAAVRFILRTRNDDGGFGSYEPRRVAFSLEWLNPAEMFGDSMTEKSYIECTASCVAALAAFRARFPRSPLAPACDLAVREGARALRAAQRPDGSWPGMWGIHFVYGTMFGVRGLLAAGVPAGDACIRRACAFVKSRQRPDGGWGEHHDSVLEDRYVEDTEGHVVQTAWALSALHEARDPDLEACERAALFLARKQRPDGTWPRQTPEGIFFHTALLEYELYRAYFPVWALAQHAARAARAAQASPDPSAGAPSPRAAT